MQGYKAHSQFTRRVLCFSEGSIRKFMPRGNRAEDGCLFDARKSAYPGSSDGDFEFLGCSANLNGLLLY